MGLSRVLVANRGEIAIRVFRAASELGLATVAVHPDDDAGSLHVRRADEAIVLPGRGAAAYLDGEALVAAALRAECDAVHPGYGFLSERADFAQRCLDAGLTFVGPRPDLLALFGDKSEGRALASRCSVPVLRGTRGPTDLDAARAFVAELDGAAVVVKAIGGGGGRGIRVVRAPDELEAAWARCRSEAAAAFGQPDVMVEEWLPQARHVEVQVVGDGHDVLALGERDCSIQRRHQKLVEIAPAPHLADDVRAQLVDAALAMAGDVRFDQVGTFEFLVGAAEAGATRPAFLEANPRLQVEHTVTEEVWGVDLVRTQLLLAAGVPLADLGLGTATAKGTAIQARVNAERVEPDGTVRPASGTITVFEPPSGPGVRVDTAAFAGSSTNPAYDSLLAKVVAHAPGDLADAARRAARALDELRIDGVATNSDFLGRVLRHPSFLAGELHTGFLDEHLAELVVDEGPTTPSPRPVLAGARVDADDPLAVLAHGKSAGAAEARPAVAVDDGFVAVVAPLQGTVVALEVAVGDHVRRGTAVAVMEAMKMEHLVVAERAGVVHRIDVVLGDTVYEGHPLLLLEAADDDAGVEEAEVEVDLDTTRHDLAEVLDRHAGGLDAARPEAVARRRATGQRTARENVDDLVDDGSFVEYAPLVVAAQRRRRTLEDLIARTPADGMIGGFASVNGDLFDEDRARCLVVSYDYTVLAGTQGQQNHRKKDRLFELAERWRLPVVFFAEGGGGRPGDTDGIGVAGLDCMAFHLWGRLSGLVPLVGITSGRCFAGNAAILACCDVVIATEGSSIGMGGPAMIEGGGLGVFRPEEVGPIEVQVPNGVVDVAVADEAEAVTVAKQYLSYFQGVLPTWECADQRRLRALVPENRVRVYDMRAVIDTMADRGSVLELRRGFGAGIVTVLARIEGRPIGIIANNPAHLGGAIDPEGADKSARFMQLCDAYDLPILFLCDTPGFMVGPEVEKEAMVRRAGRLFVIGASLDVPFFTIVVRKGYGLGAQAMAGGGFKVPMFTISWPTGEFGGMGLEGAVKLGYRNELAAIEEPAERKALYEEMVARMYEHGKALNTATMFEIDDVIDPAESRRWITAALHAAGPTPTRAGKKRPCVDAW